MLFPGCDASRDLTERSDCSRRYSAEERAVWRQRLVNVLNEPYLTMVGRRGPGGCILLVVRDDVFRDSLAARLTQAEIPLDAVSYGVGGFVSW
jgi:hypothetical protein